MAYFNMVENIRYSKIESYGVNPPENSKPVWGNNNPTEDDMVASVDLQLSLQKLSPTERKIIELYNQGYPMREIASLTNIPTMTAQHIKDRAIAKLKEMMNGKDSIYSVFT